jgi:hypothetical protein
VEPRAGLDDVENRKKLALAWNRTPAVHPVVIPTELSRILSLNMKFINMFK